MKSLLTVIVLGSLSLCLSAQTLRILPLGNSLTLGYMGASQTEGNQIGYRYQLYNLLNTAGYDYSFVGHYSTGGNHLPVSYSKHCGIRGIRDNWLAQLMENGSYLNTNDGKTYEHTSPQPYMNVYPADLILLHIGSNDAYHGETSASQVAAVGNILNAVDAYEAAHNTEVLVIIAKIISSKHSSGSCTADSDVNTYNFHLQNLINSRIASGDNIKLIDMQCGAGITYNTDMYDELHPTQDGYDKMGTHWFNAIDEIHDAPDVSTITVSPIVEGGSFPIYDLDNYVTDDYTSVNDITWELTAVPEALNAIINPDNTLEVTVVDSNWYGSESITIKATDTGHMIEALKKSTEVEVTFTVNPVNDIPIILSQKSSILRYEESTFDLDLSDFNIEDPDNAMPDFTLNILEGDDYTISANTITPREHFEGELQVAVTVSDLDDESEVFHVLATYLGVNDKPVIQDFVDTTIGTSQPLQIVWELLEVFDPDNDLEDLSLTVYGGDNYTTETNNTITPYPAFEGTLYVNMKIKDNTDADTVMYQMPVQVAYLNNPPFFTHAPSDTIIRSHVAFKFNVEVYDTNGDALTNSAESIPNFLNYYNGLLYGAPGSSHVGNTYEVVLQASDGLETTTHSFEITVIPYSNLEQTSSKALAIYPNPAVSELHVQLGEYATMRKLQVSDAYGRVLLTESGENLDREILRVDISDLANGYYMLHIFTDNGVLSNRFVKVGE